MLDRIAKSIRPHYADVAYNCTRDQLFQLGPGVLLCAICVYFGYLQAVVVGAVIVAISITFKALFTRSGPFRRFSKDQVMLTALALCALDTVAFLIPGTILASQPSVAINLTAALWIMGVMVYITNRWSHIPVFLNVMLTPSIGMMMVGFYRLTTVKPEASSSGHWWIALMFLVIFSFSVFKTLREHAERETALVQARQDAANRLAQLEQSQRLDPLTGLLNRPAFDRALFVMLNDRMFDGGQIAVFLVDLDSFKPINDTYSHDAGDAVLNAVAERLSSQLGEAGIVGRLGGDEFICAIHDITDDDDAAKLAQVMSAKLAQPIEWNDRRLRITASIGYATTTPNGSGTVESVSNLCSAADQAMFAAKHSPTGEPVRYQAHLFAPRMSAEDKQLLVEGLTNLAIKPYYQPKFHLKTGEIVGFEALARWEHPDGRVLRPGDFMDQISEMGRPGDFMNAQATQVVQDIESMLAKGLDPGQVSLNLSEVALATYTGRQDLHRIVASSPDAAKHLTFEITEDVFIARAADTIQASIATFRGLGVRISLDDFGTGFASFHHLRQLDFDELKIDTTFVDGLGRDSTSEVLVNGFLNIASGLGVGVVAEGVETEAQSRDLQNMGCMIAQGYLFSPAVPLDEALTLLSRQQAA